MGWEDMEILKEEEMKEEYGGAIILLTAKILGLALLSVAIIKIATAEDGHIKMPFGFDIKFSKAKDITPNLEGSQYNNQLSTQGYRSIEGVSNGGLVSVD